MKTYQSPKLTRSLAAVVGGFALFTGALQGAPFLYAPGDLVLAIRQPGNASDFVVNVGKATSYSTLASGVTTVVGNLSVDQLYAAFPSANGLSWSVAASSRPPGVGSFPLQTVWVTAPRTDTAVQTSPWLRKGQFTQGTAAAQIDAIGLNAAAYSSSQSINISNSVTGVIIPTSSNDYSLLPVIGDSGNYNGTFQGNVENLTPSDFDGNSASVTRSDLYELAPGSGEGRFLGYFEFRGDGTLTFNTSSAPPPKPTITSITRVGTVTTVAFTTVANATYKLISGATTVNSPQSGWTIGSSVSGSGSVLTLKDTNSAASRFFAVEALSK